MNSVVNKRSHIERRTTPLVSKLIDRDEDLNHLPAIRWGQENGEDALKSFYANEAVKDVDFKGEKSQKRNLGYLYTKLSHMSVPALILS